MKNVPYDLEIGFFNPQKTLIGWTKMAGTSPLQKEERLPLYSSPPNSQFAVEVAPGFFSSSDLGKCKISSLGKPL
jgi:hypothetical protein